MMDTLHEVISFAVRHWFMTLVAPFIVYIFIYDKNKEELDGGEEMGTFKTESQAKIWMWRRKDSYPDYDVDLTPNQPEAGEPGHMFTLDHWRRVWKVIFISFWEDDKKD